MWQRARGRKGYGVLGRAPKGRSHLARRVYYERVHGPIPDGLQIDHLCRNKSCVNPAHMEPVSGRTNLRRAIAKLNWADVCEIGRLARETALSQSAIARQFRISHTRARGIIRGQAWREPG